MTITLGIVCFTAGAVAGMLFLAFIISRHIKRMRQPDAPKLRAWTNPREPKCDACGDTRWGISEGKRTPCPVCGDERQPYGAGLKYGADRSHVSPNLQVEEMLAADRVLSPDEIERGGHVSSPVEPITPPDVSPADLRRIILD